MHRLTHPVFALGAALALLGSILSVGPLGARAQDVTPDATRPAIPATPVGDQLAWVLAQLNGGAATLTEDDVAARFAPAFLASFPAPAILILLHQTGAMAPIRLTGFAYPPTATGAIALVTTGAGEPGALTFTVEPASPHRITRLELGEPPAPPSPTGRRVDVGGRAVFLDCSGSGGPTVVLEGGLASDWAAVQPAVAGFARVCSYDRPDSPASHSDPTAIRTAQEVVDDLRAALTAAGEPGPYVLVGHSLGGLYVQLYAYRHPDEVAGLVLVDPTHEDFAGRLAALVAEAQGTPAPAAAQTDPAAPATPEEASYAQVRAARAGGPLRPMPLVVLTHGRWPAPAERPPGWPIAAEEDLWLGLNAALSRLVPNGRHVVVEGSGHLIPQERPELVVAATRDVVAAARDPGSWGAPTGTPPAVPAQAATPTP